MNMFAEVYQKDEHSLTFKIHGKQDCNYDIYMHHDAQICTDESCFLAQGRGNETIIEIPPSSPFPRYFTCKFEDGSTLLCGYRILPFDGMYNFRDLGGYPSEDGRRVKWGLLYRGDQLYNMKEKAYEAFHSLNIHSIIDFRGTSEYMKSPNTPAEIYQIKQYHCIPEGEAAALAGALFTMDSANHRKYDIDAIKQELQKDADFAGKPMICQQIEFTRNPRSIEAFYDTIQIMADIQNAPVFFHCRGGKDRTGYAAMLLLALLGVDESIILYDYMLTKRAREKKNQLYLENFRKMANGDEAVAQVLLSYFDTREDYLKAAMGEIHKSYSSIRDYAVQKMGVSEETIRKMKDNYLE